MILKMDYLYPLLISIYDTDDSRESGFWVFIDDVPMGVMLHTQHLNIANILKLKHAWLR
jgi:hypothetical protein